MMICIGLLAAKTFCVLIILRAGGYGGTLTPGLSIAALAGLPIRLTTQTIYPQVDVLATTVVGSATFLAVFMNASFTAFAVGFTRQSFDAYLPITVAIGAATAVSRLVKKPGTINKSAVGI